MAIFYYHEFYIDRAATLSLALKCDQYKTDDDEISALNTSKHDAAIPTAVFMINEISN